MVQLLAVGDWRSALIGYVMGLTFRSDAAFTNFASACHACMHSCSTDHGAMNNPDASSKLRSRGSAWQQSISTKHCAWAEHLMCG
eukprot:6175629-Pleurochrysis_carterae.AAC.2